MVYFKKAILACVDIMDIELLLDCKLVVNSSKGIYKSTTVSGVKFEKYVQHSHDLHITAKMTKKQRPVVKMCVYVYVCVQNSES